MATMNDLTFAEIFHLLTDQIAQMDARLSRQFTDQSGSLVNFEKHFTARLDRVVDALDSIQKRLNDIDERLERVEAEVVPTAADPAALLDS
jgi:ABC-type transporter Mla subunit MlaD